MRVYNRIIIILHTNRSTSKFNFPSQIPLIMIENILYIIFNKHARNNNL